MPLEILLVTSPTPIITSGALQEIDKKAYGF
jgi:hypothetical protein